MPVLLKRKKKQWTVWHDLIYIHLTLAHAADDELEDEELAAIVENMYAWMPHLEPRQMAEQVRFVMDDYSKGIDMPKLQKCIERVHAQMPHEKRTAILRDLNDIARADGTIHENEELMLKRLGEAWDVTLPGAP